MNTNTCEFLNANIRVSENVNHASMPMKSENESVVRVGRALLESYTKIAREESWLSNAHKKKCENFFSENLGMTMPTSEEFDSMKQEDLNFPNNDALYTTVVRNIVERAFRPKLVMNEIIKTITVNAKGMKDLQIPISALRTASSLPSTGILPSPSNDDYTSETIELGWIYAYEVITIQIIQQGIIDIVQDQMFELGDALSRKVDSDIVTAIETASPNTDANSNYTLLSSTMTYSDLVTGVMDCINNEALPDAIVTNPLTWANFLKSSDVVTALGYNSQTTGDVFPQIQNFLGLKIVLTTQASANNLYIVDTQRCKYLIEGSAIQMLDGRKSGTVNWEVIGLKLYGVEVIQSEAVFRLVETPASS